MMPKSAHRAHDVLDVLVRAEDNAPWCTEVARQASHSLGGALNGVPADVISGAIGKLETLRDKRWTWASLACKLASTRH